MSDLVVRAPTEFEVWEGPRPWTELILGGGGGGSFGRSAPDTLENERKDCDGLIFLDEDPFPTQWSPDPFPESVNLKVFSREGRD